MSKPSAREALTTRVFEYLVNAGKFTAPYGVLMGLHTPASGRGKVRTVTFGFARTLDATLYIWSPTRLDFRTSRDGDRTFTSEHAFYDYCAEHYGTPKVEVSA